MRPKFDKHYGGMQCRLCLLRENTVSEPVKILNQSDVYDLVKEDLATSDREVFISIMLTSKNHLIGVETLSMGSINEIILSPREVFKGSLLANAVSIILCHNHPSGDVTPSQEDIRITKRLIKAGELIGIKVLDHLVISEKGYASLQEYCTF